MRTFHLEADTGMSTSIVAEGICFSNGQVALLWKAGPSAVTVYSSIGDMEQIQNGRTTVVMGPPQVIEPDKALLERAWTNGVEYGHVDTFEDWWAMYLERGQ